MKAWRLLSRGADRVELQDVPLPQPRQGDVLIEVEAIGLNSSEMQLIRGDWDPPGTQRRYPMTPGLEAAGRIVEVGDGVDAGRLGERVTVHYRWVCGECRECVDGYENTCRYAAQPTTPKFGRTIDGSYAEYTSVPARFAIPVPDGVDPVAAAGVTVAGGTAWHMAMVRAQLRAEENVLVTGGSSGVGAMLCQVATLAGCRVAATAGGPDKAARLSELDLDLVLDHRGETDWSGPLDEMTGGRGLDCVLDIAGAGTWDRFLPSMGFRGRVIVGGYMSGETGTFDLKDSTMREISIAGSSSWSRSSLVKMLDATARGELRPVVGAELDFEALPDGLRMLRDRTAYGSLVVRVR